MTDHGAVHMVGNAHLDAVWLWGWEEGMAEVRATFRSALDRMDEDPDFTFSCDSVAYYAWLEEHDPAAFERVRLRVAEGRWELAGGWWVEPDCNLPSGEALVRQGLYGQIYLLSRFGRRARIGMNVDPFGHPGSLPQILRGQGLEAYLFFRPIAGELDLPGSVFRWRSPDGSEVLAYRLPHEYSSGHGVNDLGEHLDASRAAKGELPHDLMVFYGVGNHGGGPTRANIESVHTLASSGRQGRILFSTPERFLDAVAARAAPQPLPVVAGELQYHAPGCYSALSAVKALNRRAEITLLAAERLSAAASAAFGTPNSLRALTVAWRQLCFSQFHDLLAGTAIAPAHEAARDQVGEALSIAARVQNGAVQAIAARLDIEARPDTQPVVVVNRLAWPVRAVIEIDIGEMDREMEAASNDGQALPSQTEPSMSLVSHRGRVVTEVALPALGHRLIRIRPREGPREQDELERVTVTDDGDGIHLESRGLRVVVDRATGWLGRIVGGGSGTTIATPVGMGHAVVLEDPGDTWLHGRDRFGAVVGRFTPESVQVVQAGPVRAVVRVCSRFGASHLTEDLIVADGSPYLEVRVRLDWREEMRVLKLRVPTSLVEPRAVFEVPYGTVERPATGREEPGQTWVDIVGRTTLEGVAGVAVLTDSKYAYDVEGGSLGFTAARSPIFAWHHPKQPEPDGLYAYQDIGVQQFRYAVLPHSGTWADAFVPYHAAAFNTPPVTLLEGAHSGTLASIGTLAEVHPRGVSLAALKAAEDGSPALVARLVELHGERVRARLELTALGRVIVSEIGPYEVRSFRIPLDLKAPVEEVDLIELGLASAG